jgi:hypothetical protein
MSGEIIKISDEISKMPNKIIKIVEHCNTHDKIIKIVNEILRMYDKIIKNN